MNRVWVFRLAVSATLLTSIHVSAATPPAQSSVLGGSRMDVRLLLEVTRPRKAHSNPWVSFFVQARDSHAVARTIRSMGAHTGAVAGDVITVRARTRDVSKIALLPGVVKLEAAVPVYRRLDQVVTTLGVDRVHQGTGLPAANQGAGVVMGVVDYGLDLSHPAFKNGNNTRVLSLWDQSATGTPPAGYTYGSECTRAQIDSGSCPFNAQDAHGTHVTGIAAGGPVSGQPYGGMAPQADIVFVHLGSAPNVPDPIDALSTAICDGAAYIFAAAATAGRPAVINMSLGYHEDSHDGRSLATRCLDNLAGPGKIMVAAAGNEGVGGTHPSLGHVSVHAQATATGTPQTVRFALGRAPQAVPIYFESGVDVSARVGFIEGTTPVFSPVVSLTGSTVVDFGATSLTGTGMTLGDVTGLAQRDSTTGVGVVAFYLEDTDNNQEELAASWVLEVTGTGRFDVYIDTTPNSGFIAGGDITPDDSQSIGPPAVAAKVLAVASTVNKATWTDSMGNSYDQTDSMGAPVVVGNLSDFSSRGPSRVPSITGQKPDFAAPGEVVVSALNQASVGTMEAAATDIVVDSPGGFIKEQGTSMASPAVAGVVALLLAERPALTVEDARAALNATAVPLTGDTVPNNNMGYGRVDAQAALLNILGGASSSSSSGGASSSGGGSSSSGAASSSSGGGSSSSGGGSSSSSGGSSSAAAASSSSASSSGDSGGGDGGCACAQPGSNGWPVALASLLMVAVLGRRKRS